MAVEVSRPAIAAPPPAGVSLWSRVYGLGSVYAKTLRDSRLTFIIMAGLLGGLMIVAGAGVGTVYKTAATRHDLAALATDLSAQSPVLRGLVGNPINVGTIGGYVMWKYGPVLVFIACLWSIVALSGTLAGEARQGSLEMVAVSPFGRRRLALEKLAAHLTALTGALVILGLATAIATSAFATLPGDAIPPAGSIGFALWVGLLALASGSVAFALGPFIGRGAAGWVAGVWLFGGYLLNGYRALVPGLSGVADLSWFSWTANHVPLAGLYDWPSLIPVAVASVVLLAIGVEGFARRDLGATSALRTPPLPAALLGVRGAIGRAFADRVPSALAWALGLGFFGFVMAAASGSLTAAFHGMSQSTLQIFHAVLPGYDLTSAGGLLQFIFVALGYIVVGFCASMLVGGWASDETSGRLELLLATPLSRVRWAVSGAIGVYLALAVMTAVLAVAIGLGALAAGSNAATPMEGSIVLGLYAAAVAGVGFAVGGLFRTTIAGEVVALVVIATFLIDLLAPALKWPTWVHGVALTSHLGQPMVGVWDGAGITACIVVAVAGLAIGAFGVHRRDMQR